MSSRTHTHVFHLGNPLAQRNTRWAMWLTLVTMLLEISGGWWFNSMALLADGWHMSSHALALGLSALAYAAARRYAHDQRFAFGTWKIEILGGFSSALMLLGVAALMLIQSLERLFNPAQIHYEQAIALALLGLLVNLLCAWLLHAAGHAHHHDHHHEHAHHHHHHAHDGHHDLNLRAAYLHVLADAATSVLAIVALLAGMVWGAAWLDPVMGIVGAVLVALWAKGLLQQTGRILLDAEMDAPQVAEIREVVAALPVAADITDLHLWRVGQESYACILVLETAADITADEVRSQLAIHDELAHVTVEINRLPG